MMYSTHVHCRTQHSTVPSLLTMAPLWTANFHIIHVQGSKSTHYFKSSLTLSSTLSQYAQPLPPPAACCAVLCCAVRYADIIIPWQRGDNLVAIDLITQHIKSKLSCHELCRHYPNLEIMPSNFQVCDSEGVTLQQQQQQ